MILNVTNNMPDSLGVVLFCFGCVIAIIALLLVRRFNNNAKVIRKSVIEKTKFTTDEIEDAMEEFRNCDAQLHLSFLKSYWKEDFGSKHGFASIECKDCQKHFNGASWRTLCKRCDFINAVNSVYEYPFRAREDDSGIIEDANGKFLMKVSKEHAFKWSINEPILEEVIAMRLNGFWKKNIISKN